MHTLTVSQENLASSLYLDSLISQQGLLHFCIKRQCLLSDTALPGSVSGADSFAKLNHAIPTKKLLIFAEGLSLQKLATLVETLESVMTFSHFRVIRHGEMSRFALCAEVSVHDKGDLRPLLGQLATAHSVELCLVDSTPSLNEPGLLLMDMDSTVIACECIDDIALLAGVGEEVSKVTALAMQGKLDFAESLRSRVACLKNADEAILQKVRDALPLMPGIFNLVRVLKSHGWKLAIASGGFTYFADYLAKRLELDAAVANQLEISNGQLTGQVVGDIVDAKRKADTLHEFAKQWGIPAQQCVAMGDGANDLVMMNAAALGVAFHAKPIVQAQADISIRRGDLDALIWVLAI